MILKSFKYSTVDWTLDNLTFGKANLIVGKNSSGKSRALNALGRVKTLLSQRNAEDIKDSFSSEIIFIDNKDREIFISLKIEGKKIINETLKVNGDIKIQRQGPVGTIENESGNPPEDMLLMHVRRDVERYDYIEDIINWCEETVIRSFIDRNTPSQNELYELFSKFTTDMKHDLIKMINEVGFPLNEIDTFDNIFKNQIKKSISSDSESIKIKYIVIYEQNVGYLLLDDLSSGMYRTILLLILIEQLKNLDHPALLAIDDLGEGLDYSRATKVGKKLFEICEEKNIQLIATSNEEFMMNIVDINKWNILVRNGEVVKSLTSALCPKEFKDFKFSGLSNFDFFTSDFLNRMTSKMFGEEK